MALIQVNQLTFAYEGSYDNIFENVSFQIDTNWKLGFTGRNGRGKTTFLQLLLGKYEYKGSITSNVQFEYFPYSIENQDRLTIDIIDELNPNYEYWQLARELHLLQVGEELLYRPFSSLSGGEQCKIALAVLFLKEHQFLLIDEPTNHLDREGREIVSQYLKKKKGFILVSHDRAFLDQCVDHILSINKTNIEIRRGNFSSWWSNKQLQDNFELAQNEKLKKDIKRLEQAAKRTSNWSHEVEKTKNGTLHYGSKPDKGYIGHKAAKMMKRAKSMERRQQDALEEKAKLLKNIELNAPIKITPLDYYKKQLVEARQLVLKQNNIEICKPVSFTIEQGDRIAITGKNGSGKSTLLKLICGENIAYQGSLSLGSQLKISYVSQTTSHLSGNLRDYAALHGIDEAQFKTLLRKFDFSRDQFDKDMASFSAGQKKKVLIARSLCEQAHLYVWDEPLNFIDVISRMQIEQLLLEYRPTLLFVEHDFMFLEQIASKIVELDRC